ncbi:MAG: 50S ribosomal protein L4 [Patescibacteria group bacterium]|nr:50S ribosomal protein L4 [Patescibacteria group bacterium]MDE2437808.1 50S ribosomal protein L4 [Patescibacteria group bacterium]
MKLELYNALGSTVGSVDVADGVFDVKWNADLVHQVLRAYTNNARRPVAHTKDRGAVQGGGKKPWKQKGTGRARAGSSRSPIWKGGGVTHGPLKEKNYHVALPKKMARKAIAMALSQKLREQELKVVDVMEFSDSKTKSTAHTLKPFANLEKAHQLLIVIPQHHESLRRSIHNLKAANWVLANDLNAKKIITYKNVVILKDSLPIVEKYYTVA